MRIIRLIFTGSRFTSAERKLAHAAGIQAVKDDMSRDIETVYGEARSRALAGMC